MRTLCALAGSRIRGETSQPTHALGIQTAAAWWRNLPHGLLSVALMALGVDTPAFSQQSTTGKAPAIGRVPATTKHACDVAFLEHCAFVCVDIQPAVRRHVGEAEVPKLWHTFGFTAADVNAATDYAFNVAYPNARRVADACRSAHLPMIFLHWGCLFKDGMDLDPVVRKELQGQHGTNYDAWGHCLLDSNCRPAAELGVRPGEYVLPKTAQDAFTSSNLGFVLTNLNVRQIVFIGGHTEACLGKTASAARQRGFRTLCVEDATFNARESSRAKGIEQAQYDYVLTTAQFLELVKEAAGAVTSKDPKNRGTRHPD